MENQQTPEGKTPILQRVAEFNNILSQAQESIPSDVKVKWNELYSELSHHQEANAEQERLYKSELWHLGERSTNEIKRLEEANAKLVEELHSVNLHAADQHATIHEQQSTISDLEARLKEAVELIKELDSVCESNNVRHRDKEIGRRIDSFLTKETK